MEYFNFDNKKDYIEGADKKYDVQGKAVRFFKETKEKLKHFIGLLSKELASDFIITYEERPNKQPGKNIPVKLKSYINIGFIPRKYLEKVSDNLFVKIQFLVKNNKLYFNIEMDVNIKNNLSVDREKIINDTLWLTEVNNDFPQNWILLLKLTSDKVKETIQYFTKFIDTKYNQNSKSEIELPEKNEKMKISLNQILYGPPGTGKTYNTINRALEIIGENILGKSRLEIKDRFNEKMKEGRIVFTTFHQSMSYEDFIEGIKPLKPEEGDEFVKYEVQDGIFKRLCNDAKAIAISNKIINWDEVFFFKMSLGGKNRPEIHDWCISNNVIALGYGGNIDLSEMKKFESWIEYRDQFVDRFPELVEESRFNIQSTYAFMQMQINDIVIISKGNQVIDAIGIVKSDYYFDDSNPIDFVHYRKVEWLATDMKASPQRFFEKKISQQSIYLFNYDDIKLESFYELTKESPESKEEKPFVIIIDEINRGNVSQIFGELITLIEDDKRQGKDEALEVILPYSKDKFSVPPNLYIIGTMNTADRSVEALDAALRRRFSFTEMPPDSSLIASDGLLKEDMGLLGDIDLPLLLDTINRRIEKLLDKDHLIGHSYFIKVSSLDGLKFAFHHEIIPLLQEYFFGDYGKIGLVLGKGFIYQETEDMANIFADFDDYDASAFSEKTIYKLHDVTSMSDEDFITAITILLN